MVYVAVALVIGVSRLPLIRGAGLGLDPDAWRLYEAGQIAAASGTYAPSRPPGYPAVELVALILHDAPFWMFAVATTGVTVVGALAATALARELKVRAWPLVGLGMAFTYVVFANSTAFMDYNWSMASLLCGLYLISRRRAVPAGLMLGLAVACRPATIFAESAALIVLLLDRTWWFRRLFWLAAVAGATVIAFFAVPLATYGTALVSAAPVPLVLSQVFHMATIDLWGEYGSWALVAAAAIALTRLIWSRGKVVEGRAIWVYGLFGGIVVQLLGFLLLPGDPAYLIPVVPMVWLLAGLLLNRLEMAALAVVMTLAAILPASVGDSVIQVTAARRAQMRDVAAFLERVKTLAPGTVVVVHAHLPQMAAMVGATVPPAIDPEGHTTRITLPGGQVLAYNATG